MDIQQEAYKKLQDEYRNGLTQEDLAAKYKISQQLICNLISKKRKFSQNMLKKLFPEMEVRLYGDNNIGNVSGGANNKNNKINSDNNFFKEEPLMPKSNTIIQKK